MASFNHDAVEQSTVFMLQNGIYLLQAHRFAATEMEHAVRLLKWADPEHGARIIDMGSGIGAMAAAWLQVRPDLKFTLVNINKFQLDMSPASCDQLHCSMTAVHVEDDTQDMAICCFSIGHADVDDALAEMARVVRPGGVVFIYDMHCDQSSKNRLTDFAYELTEPHTLKEIAEKHGLHCDFYMEPNDRGTLKNAVPELADVFGNLKPVIWRFINRGSDNGKF